MKRRRKEIMMLALFILAGCMLLAGCDIRNYVYTKDSLKRVAQRSLKKKYGESFVIHEVWDRSQEMFFATCSPKDDPDVIFQADIMKNGDGVDSDGYAQGIVAKEINENLKEDFQEVFGDCYTRAVILNYYKPKFEDAKNVTMKEYLKMGGSDLGHACYYVFALESELKEDYIYEEYKLVSEKVLRKIKSEEIPNVIIYIYIVNREMKSKSEDYFSKYISKNFSFDEELKEYPSIGFGYPDGEINRSFEEYKEFREER